jgi:hypothetical protein
MAHQAFTAIEAKAQVRNAIKVWREKFAKDAETMNGLGGAPLWHPRLAMWGHFGKWERKDGSDRYWNPFGLSPVRLRQNMIVEINPPANGRDGRMQGVLAHADDGSRWVLHKGQMAISRAHISEAQFDAVSLSKRAPVTFSDGTVIDCHPVANVEADATELQDQIALFVAECRRVRLHYSLGSKVAEQEAAVEAAESSTPELGGSYLVGAQGSKVAFRLHGEVWQSLAKGLDQIGAKHTNGRVGRWGPDLRTVGDKPVLFEIKVATIASDIQCAVGQLLLYERLLKTAHRKVLVLPGALGGHIARTVEELGVEVLLFAQKSRAVNFDLGHLTQLTT